MKKPELTIPVPIRLLVSGDRNWTDFGFIYKTIQAIGEDIIEVLIHGDARGVDKQSGAAAKLLGIDVLAFPANWTKHGNSAGPIRNRLMIKEGKPTLVLCIHDNLKKSKGTKDMKEVADKAGIQILVIGHRNPLPEFTVRKSRN